MAGIGFELRKLFHKQGLLNYVRAYGYSSLTTIGPMLLSMLLVFILQRMIILNDGTPYERELYMAVVQYCLIFSITLTSGLTMVLTRYIADMIYQKRYEHLLSSYYGGLACALPIGMIIAWLFLSGVSVGFSFKMVAYLFFALLIIVWVQTVYLSALKDYIRIVRSYAVGALCSLVCGWLLMAYTPLSLSVSAIIALDIGFLIIGLLFAYHFHHVFPPAEPRLYFSFLSYFRKYRSLFWSGLFFYGGVFVHSFVYWFGPLGVPIVERFYVSPYYDLPVFFAFITVIPTLVTFVVSVETSFYVTFKDYYSSVGGGGTYAEIRQAKKEMQRTLSAEISFLMEVQLIFTIVSFALGILLLPRMGMTMTQLDTFNILLLGYFLYIMMFVLVHILMYFDDRKGVFMLGTMFVALNISLSIWAMWSGHHGFGFLIAAFLTLCVTIGRLLYVVNNIDYFTYCAQPLFFREDKRNTARISRRHRIGTMLVALPIMLTLAACTSDSEGDSSKRDPEIEESAVHVAENQPTLEHKGIAEDKRIYAEDQDDSVKAIYVTVLPDEREQTPGLTWYGLNRITDRYSEDSLEIIIQEGKDGGSGPEQGMFGYGENKANAKISLRGNTARYTSQKSYKIKLYDHVGLWLNQRTFNLNKHALDFSRIRNKLSFDLMEQIPDITSLRTQFIRLYVKDISEDGNAQRYEDYGLYTHVEQPNKRFLKSHWLDPYGYLYKVTFFEFFRYPDHIKSQDDPTYDIAAFESILEIKGREDHTKLIAMLEDVNDMSIPIEEVMEKHFDLDNFLTWLSVNILMDNMDTDANNYYLYSPLNSDKWYFLPWDYDGGWGLHRERGNQSGYQSGLSNYWVSVLHNRFFRSEENVQLLKDKLQEVSRYINEETVRAQLELYKPAVMPIIERAPDLNYLPQQLSNMNEEYEKIAKVPEMGLRLFLEDLEKPKPFYQHDVVREDGVLTFTWGISFDLQGDELEYDWFVAHDPLFTRIIAEQQGLKDPIATLDVPASGRYFWKVIVRDSVGNEQISFDRYVDDEGDSYYGMREFEVN